MPIFAQLAQKKLMSGDHKITKLMCEGEVVYSSGNIVTYIVDSGVTYSEEWDSDEDILTPKNFTPTKDGWSFVGWREDTAANASVLSSKTMESDPITLYAVFKQTIIRTFISYEKTQDVRGDRYYNNGTAVNPTIIAPSGSTYDGWTWRGWANVNNTTANAGVSYAVGTSMNPPSNGTHYGLYEKTVTVSYYAVSDATEKKATGKRYWNAYGTWLNPTFTINPSGYGAEWTFRGWTTATAADAAVTYSAISNTEFVDDITLYILLQRLITISFNGNNATSGSVASQTGYVYLNSYNANTTKDATFTLPANGFARTNKSFVAWSIGSTSGTQYVAGKTVSLSSNTTFFAVWQQVYTPYTIGAFKNYNWTYSSGTGAATEAEVRDNELYMLVERTGGGSVSRQYSATLPTQGCNRMRVKYTSIETYDDRYAFIYGTNINSEAKDAYLYFNIDENATSIEFVAGIWTNTLETEVELYVKEIYFYYE